MKQLFILFAFVCLVSCDTASSDEGKGLMVEEITFDGCQYLKGTWTSETPLVHKGNCNNPIHVYKIDSLKH